MKWNRPVVIIILDQKNLRKKNRRSIDLQVVTRKPKNTKNQSINRKVVLPFQMRVVRNTRRKNPKRSIRERVLQ